MSTFQFKLYFFDFFDWSIPIFSFPLINRFVDIHFCSVRLFDNSNDHFQEEYFYLWRKHIWITWINVDDWTYISQERFKLLRSGCWTDSNYFFFVLFLIFSLSFLSLRIFHVSFSFKFFVYSFFVLHLLFKFST